MPEFYSPQGLREIAFWLNELIDVRRKTTQKAIADCVGVASSTIGSLRMHDKNVDSLVSRKPDPDLILRLAECIPDPITGQTFTDPWRLMRVAMGFESLYQRPAESEQNKPSIVISNHPYPKAAQHIRDLMGDRSVEQAAKDWDMSAERLEELLTTTDPDRAIPNGIEVHRISQNYPDKLANRLLQFYAEPQTAKNGGRKRLKK